MKASTLLGVFLLVVILFGLALVIKVEVRCPHCHGLGYIEKTTTCPTCHGTGRVLAGLVTCPRCHGTGHITTIAECPYCHGTGKVRVSLLEAFLMGKGWP